MPKNCTVRIQSALESNASKTLANVYILMKQFVSLNKDNTEIETGDICVKYS